MAKLYFSKSLNKSGLTSLRRISISKLSFCSLVLSIARKLARPFSKFLSIKLAF